MIHILILVKKLSILLLFHSQTYMLPHYAYNIIAFFCNLSIYNLNSQLSYRELVMKYELLNILESRYNNCHHSSTWQAQLPTCPQQIHYLYIILSICNLTALSHSLYYVTIPFFFFLLIWMSVSLFCFQIISHRWRSIVWKNVYIINIRNMHKHILSI